MARAGWELVRYADDFVILCRSEAEAQTALSQVREWVQEAGRRWHPEKTRIVNAAQPGGFDFLGYHFERGLKWPRKKSREKLKERLREKTPRKAGRSLKDIIRDVKRTLRGWYGYFQHRQANVFPPVDSLSGGDCAVCSKSGVATRGKGWGGHKIAGRTKGLPNRDCWP